MSDVVCKYCGSSLIELKSKGPHTGIYCACCGKWIKWLGKGGLTGAIKQQIAKTNEYKANKKQGTMPEAPVVTNATPAYPMDDDIPLPEEAPPFDYCAMPAPPVYNPDTAKNSEALVLLVHGFTEIERADGRCIPLPLDTRVVIEASSIKIYNIATKELLQEISR